jgi:hypothetical protein
MAISGKRKTTIGVGHDGAPRAGFIRAGDPGAPVAHPNAIAAVPVHTGMKEVAQVQGLGKPPKIKHARFVAPAVHDGMTTTSRVTGRQHYGADDLSRADADPASPLGGPPQGKRLSPVRAVPGMRSRVSDLAGGGAPGENHIRGRRDPRAMAFLGAAVLNEALARSAPDDRMALDSYGIATSLPQSVKEN